MGIVCANSSFLLEYALLMVDTERPRNFISRYWFLTGEQIKELSVKTTTDQLTELCTVEHPTTGDELIFEELCIQRPSTLDYWLDIRGALKQVTSITNIPPETTIDILLNQALRISAAVPTPKGTTVEFHYTNNRSVHILISELSEKNSGEYLRLMSGVLRENIVNLVKRKPTECDRLRAFCTYSPEANGGKILTAIEPKSWHERSDYGRRLPKAVTTAFGTNFILLGGK